MKTKKGKAILTLGAVWLAAFVLIVATKGMTGNGENGIVTAFESGNYLDTEGTVSAYVNYGNKYLTDDDRRSIIGDITRALGIDRDITLDIKRGESEVGNTVTAKYSCIGQNAKTDISIITIESNSGKAVLSTEQYVLVDISVNNSVKSALYYKECIDNYFKNMGINADITLNIKGSMKGVLSNNEKNEICEEILEALDGKLITGSRSDELYTVYAYSESIKEYVVNGTTKSNINVAITYDSTNDLSWVYVATPILSESY